MKNKLGTTLLILAVLLTSAHIYPTQALDYTVNTTDDVDDGTCDATHCSLREAINAANGSMLGDTISFNIVVAGDVGCNAGTAVCTIQPTTPLPALTDDGITIDGYTQPGAAPATDQSSAVIKIEIDGTSVVPTTTLGLEINSSFNIVSGLAIGNFFCGISLHGSDARFNKITGNHLGTDASGTLDRGNADSGILLYNGPQHNLIGGDEPAERNVISGNETGVWIDGTTGTTGANTVSGNHIGTDASGSSALGNDIHGIWIDTSPHNTIGGSSIGEQNLIAGNGSHGIHIDDSSDTVVKGNLIGVTADGSAIPNGGSGIRVYGESDDVVIGPDNVIAHNAGRGVFVADSNADHCVVTQNSIHANGSFAIQNMDTIGQPVITGVDGALDVLGNTDPNCVVEVFANPVNAQEGRTFIGTSVSDGSGNFTVTVPLTAVLAGPYLTATATDASMGTSWFSGVYDFPVERVHLPLAIRGN